MLTISSLHPKAQSSSQPWVGSEQSCRADGGCKGSWLEAQGTTSRDASLADETEGGRSLLCKEGAHNILTRKKWGRDNVIILQHLYFHLINEVARRQAN